jgi:hypothetical protein
MGQTTALATVVTLPLNNFEYSRKLVSTRSVWAAQEHELSALGVVSEVDTALNGGTQLFVKSLG